MKYKLYHIKNRLYKTIKLDGVKRKINKDIDPSILVGDTVCLVDGSALSLKSDDKLPFTEYSIIYSYPKITGDYHDLRFIKGTVTKVGIKNRLIHSGFDWCCCYLQDIIVKLGNAEFRTNSSMVQKVNQ